MVRSRNIYGTCMLALAVSPASPASAQPTVVHSLQWVEVYAGTNTPVSNPNGILEPGEAARLVISASVIPDIGQPVNNGVMAGLGGLFVGLETLGNPGSWSLTEAAPGFSLWSNAQPFSPTLFGGAGGHQPFGGGHWMPDPSNPVHALWQGVWMPDSYAPREVTMAMLWFSHMLPMVWLHRGTDPTTGYPLLNLADAGFLPHPLPRVQIPVIPAPAGGTLLAVALVLMAARRRRCAESGLQRC